MGNFFIFHCHNTCFIIHNSIFMSPVIIIFGVALGLAAGYLLRSEIGRRQTETAEAKARSILEDAKAQEKDLLLQAKDKAIKVMDDVKKEEVERRKELSSLQQRLDKRENLVDKKLVDVEDKEKDLAARAEKLEAVKEELKGIRQQQFEKLEKIAGMTKDEAGQVLIQNMEGEVKEELLARLRKLDQIAEEEWESKAKDKITQAMERVASSHSVETTVTSVTIPSDDMKGRIIGREGRNIKAIEQQTGTEIVVDETPNTIFISGFSPIRRQIARIAIEKLILDGRIHPGRIEEAIEDAKKNLALVIKKAGEDAVFEVGVAGLDPKLVQILGRLKYRTSYGHNVLRHSIEVSLISGLLAEELGANVSVAKKGGLLHDIGKAVDHEVQGGHPEIGQNIMKKFGLPEEVAYISIAHHEDHPKTIEGIIVKVADAISGARPGARKDT